MRRPLPGDLILFARLLCVCPVPAMPALARRILAQTETADIFRIQQGKAHPYYGDGSLVGRIMRENLPALTHADTPEFLTALRIVAEQVLKHTAP